VRYIIDLKIYGNSLYEINMLMEAKPHRF